MPRMGLSVWGPKEEGSSLLGGLDGVGWARPEVWA